MARLNALPLLAWALSACGATPAPAASLAAARPATPTVPEAAEGDGPRLVRVIRDGDGEGAFAVAASTEGLAEDRGALPAVALGALVEERLAARGIAATAAGGWNGWRLRTLVASAAEASRIVGAVREALLQPVVADDPALAAVARKTAWLARRPLPAPQLRGVVRCTGEAFASGDLSAPSAAELEAWRGAAHGLERVAVAASGDAATVAAVAEALARAVPWPHATRTPAAWPDDDDAVTVYEASGDVAPGAARIVATARTWTASGAVAVAPALGDPRGPLASRLAGLDAPARIRSVVATSRLGGGCLAVTLDLGAQDLVANGAARIATAAALARQELSLAIGDDVDRSDAAEETARRAPDPRDAAERAAWWALGARARRHPRAERTLALNVGVAAARGAAEPPNTEAVRAEIDRATLAWQSPVVEGRVRVERGQGEAWLLLGSPCGTSPEALGDAGLGAAVALAAAAQADAEAGDARVEPFVDAAGLGVIVHGPARPGEAPSAHVRRLADVTARALAAVPLDGARIDGARAALLARATDTTSRLFATLAGAVAPEHPSWLAPAGTAFGLMSATNEAIATRAAALRAGPLRVAVLADADAGQAGAAVIAVDRWVARRPGDTRACPDVPSRAAPRAGTYAVDLPVGAASQALLAAPLPVGDASARRAALTVAAALDGPKGLLAHALAADAGAGPGALAREWSAKVIGGPDAQALVVRIVAPDGALDPAVAQTRALLDRVRQESLRDEDRARAEASLSRARADAALDPRARLVALWLGEGTSAPAASTDELRAFAASSLRDDGLVIVAARPSWGAGAKR